MDLKQLCEIHAPSGDEYKLRALLLEEAKKLYKEAIERGDYLSLTYLAGIYYFDEKDYEKAKEVLLKALDVVDSYEEARIPQATTRTKQLHIPRIYMVMSALPLRRKW